MQSATKSQLQTVRLICLFQDTIRPRLGTVFHSIANRPFAARGHMVRNPTSWRAKKCNKTPLENVNKEKSHFSSYLCFVLESGTFFCVPIWRILYHVTSSCKGPIDIQQCVYSVAFLTSDLHHNYSKTSFEKNCFSAWASTLNMGLINEVDMVCLSPVGYGV